MTFFLLQSPESVVLDHLSWNGAAAAFKGPDGGLDRAKFEKRTYTSDLYYGSITAYDAVSHKVLAKTVTDIEIRSGATVTAGGLVFSALQDGWVVAYDDEKLQELWRFNVGTPLKGAPVELLTGVQEAYAEKALAWLQNGKIPSKVDATGAGWRVICAPQFEKKGICFVINPAACS